MRNLGARTVTAMILLGTAVGTTLVVSAAASGSDGRRSDGNSVRTDLSGYAEVPLALSSPGSGTFRARIDERNKEIRYSLSYSDFPTRVTQAHIHFGSVSQAGGISAFLCTNLGNGPAGTPACPPDGGTVEGTIKPADVVGPAGQGIAAGEFAELVAAIEAGATYANVHTDQFQAGEIRGQI